MPRDGDAAATARPGEAGPAAGIVGREAELALLRDFLHSTRATVLVIEGEAGIGKTTLWTAGVAEARSAGSLVLACRPSAAEAELSYGALGDLVGPYLGDVLPELPAPQRWALEVALLLREAGGPPPDQRAIGMALLGVLRNLSQEAPVLVAVDDGQWVDPVSAGVVEFALRRLAGEPVRVLVAVRVGEHLTAPMQLERAMSEERLERLPVGPLSLGALYRLLRARLGAALPRPTLVRVHEASDGNPFYALQLARALLEQERTAEAGRRLPIPDSLDELLYSRLAQLPPPVRDVLAIAAAMANPTVPTLAEAAGSELGAVLAELDAAAAAGVVELNGDRVRFGHPLLASSAYWHAGETGRRSLHRRLAEVATDVEERARHLALATVGPDEEVAAALDAAAARAASRGAAVGAADLAELAVRLTPASNSVAVRRRVIGAAERHVAAGDLGRARGILEDLIGVVPPGAERADALVLLARTRQDDVEAQRKPFEQALQDTADDPARQARVRRGLAEIANIRGDQQGALAYARSAIPLAEASGNPALLASTLAYVALFETFLGEATPGLLERAIALEDAAGYLPGYDSPSMVLGHRLVCEDRFDEARGWLEKAEHRAAARDDFTSRMWILLHLAEAELGAGNWSLAARHAAEGLELAEQLDADHSRSALLYAVTRVDALLGLVDAAREAGTRGVALARMSSSEFPEFYNQWALGFLQLSLGDSPGAMALLEPLLELGSFGASRGALCTVLPDLIEALIGVGAVDRAEELLATLEGRARELQRPSAVAASARCRGLLLADQGHLEAALARFAEALEAHERLPNPFERGRTLLALGETQRRARRRRAARESLQAALALFEELGAPLWAEKARRELARIGGRAPAAGALTPTEERVAALVAEGRTNREAAKALYLSEHTIEGHLSRIYAKLGVRSRAELAHRLAARAAEHVDS